jgi:hypothetical protein
LLMLIRVGALQVWASSVDLLRPVSHLASCAAVSGGSWCAQMGPGSAPGGVGGVGGGRGPGGEGGGGVAPQKRCIFPLGSPLHAVAFLRAAACCCSHRRQAAPLATKAPQYLCSASQQGLHAALPCTNSPTSERGGAVVCKMVFVVRE